MEKLLIYGSVVYAWWLLEGEDATEDGDDLQLSDKDAKDIAGPWARMIARTAFNKTQGRKVINSMDFIDSFVTIGLYVHRTTPYLRARMRKLREPNRRQPPERQIHRTRGTNNEPDRPPTEPNGNAEYDGRPPFGNDGTNIVDANFPAGGQHIST